MWILVTDTTKEQLFEKDNKSLNNNLREQDYENYKNILFQTNVLHQDSNPKKPPRGSRSFKWNNILANIYKKEMELEDDLKEGEGIFLPGDIKGLKTKLNLLLAEFRAGNTSTRNEIVFILDELLRRKQMSGKEYTEINNFLQ